MAKHQERPDLDLAAGADALEQTLPVVLKALRVSDLAELGWRRLGANSLLIPMVGNKDGQEERYLLKLHFKAGRAWPPSAQFVNPDTLNYEYPSDQQHLPTLSASYCHVHAAYPQPPRTLQLICCSATYEYYQVLHSGDDTYLWRDTDTFLVTLGAIERAFRESYAGRMPAHG